MDMEQEHIEICGRYIEWTDYGHKPLYALLRGVCEVRCDYWLGVF